MSSLAPPQTSPREDASEAASKMQDNEPIYTIDFPLLAPLDIHQPGTMPPQSASAPSSEEHNRAFIFSMDSMFDVKTNIFEPCAKDIWMFLLMIANERKEAKLSLDELKELMTYYQYDNIPVAQQTNGYDCGVFIVKFCELIATSANVSTMGQTEWIASFQIGMNQFDSTEYRQTLKNIVQG